MTATSPIMHPMRQFRVLRAALRQAEPSSQKGLGFDLAAGAELAVWPVKCGELGRQHGLGAVSRPCSGMVQEADWFKEARFCFISLVFVCIQPS